MNIHVKYGDCAIQEPFHYTWSGLEDVYLLSGYERVPSEDGEDIIIQDMDGLHRAIGQYLAKHKKTLNGNEIRFLRKQMDLTQNELGMLMGTTDQTVARWEKGECPIAGPADALLRLFYLNVADPRSFLQRLRAQDELTTARMEFCETEEGWKAAA